ncbi:hypothetical protein YC2023_016985 [Brassica napus]
MSIVFVRTYDFNDGTNELEHFVSEGYELLGIFNWSDHFPGARWLDLQGVRRRCRSLVGEVNVFVGNIIDDHILKRSLHDNQEEEITNEDDFVDFLVLWALLEDQDPPPTISPPKFVERDEVDLCELYE